MPGFNDFPQVNTLAAAFRAVKAIPSSMHEHMDYLREAAAGSRSVLELGLNQGTSCVAFLTGLPAGSRMVSVDLQGPLTPIRFILEWCAGEIRKRNWMFMESDTLEAMRKMRDWGWEFDLIFVDSSHQYQATKDELALAADLVVRTKVSGGKIILHDTISFPEVYRAMLEFTHERGWQFGNRENCHGLGVITVPGH